MTEKVIMDTIMFKENSLMRKQVDKANSLISGPKTEQFKKLATNFEKFKFVRDNVPKIEVAASRPNVPDLKRSLELKDEGNKLFKQERLHEAREFYTKSLQICPVNFEQQASNKEYAIMLANRSATLDVQGPYYACLQDIELAFKYGYPKEMYYKLYNRKGHALLKMKQYVTSKEAFKLCENWIGKSDLPEKQREIWHNRMKKQFNVFGCTKKLANVEEPKRPLEDKLENLGETLKFNDDMTDVVASKDIAAEDFLLKEKSFATVVYDDGPSVGKVCPITLTRVAAPIPCSFGSNVVFSSETARDKANASFHKYEWMLVENFKENGLSPTARLALRLITSLEPTKVKQVAHELRQSEVKPKFSNCLSDEARVFTLPAPTSLSMENSICLYLLVNYFMECLKVGKYFNPAEAGVNDMTSDLVFLLTRAILVCNAHATSLNFGVYLENKAEVWNMTKYPVSSYAVGIFPKFALLKDVSVKAAAKSGTGSDVISFFQDDTIIIQSFHKISSGKPVNLGDDIRGKIEMMMPQDMVPFKCNGKDCGLSFPLHEKTNQNTINCPSETCGIETNIWQKRRRIVEIRAQYDALHGQIEKGKIRSAINFLHDLIAEWDKIIARPYKEFTKLDEHLIKLMLMEHVEKEDEWIGFYSHWMRRAK